MIERPMDIESIAGLLVAPGKGILAADESTGTIEKRFKSIDVESTEEPPRLPRAAVHDRRGGRVHQRRDPVRRDDPPAGRRRHAVPGVLDAQGIIPGIKVDKGAKPLAGSPARRSLRASTDCATGWPSTASSAPGSPSGAR